jgi:hypothetical protein
MPLRTPIESPHRSTKVLGGQSECAGQGAPIDLAFREGMGTMSVKGW